ncbi:MAG: hypothetical protein AB1425_14490 [Actinomycetota bacterium]
MSASRKSSDRDAPGRVIRRLRLLDELIEARESSDRRRADRALVEATRWLRRYPGDVRVLDARSRLRGAYPVDADDARRGSGEER